MTPKNPLDAGPWSYSPKLSLCPHLWCTTRSLDLDDFVQLIHIQPLCVSTESTKDGLGARRDFAASETEIVEENHIVSQTFHPSLPTYSACFAIICSSCTAFTAAFSS